MCVSTYKQLLHTEEGAQAREEEDKESESAHTVTSAEAVSPTGPESNTIDAAHVVEDDICMRDIDMGDDIDVRKTLLSRHIIATV